MKKKILLVVIVIGLFVLSGCSNLNFKDDTDNLINDTKTKEEKKQEEMTKLSNYLLENGYEEIEDGCYKYVLRQINDDEGKPYNWNITYFYTTNLSINVMTALKPVGINTTTTYYYLTDTADGTSSFFDNNGVLENIVNYSYDFNNGSLSCSSGTCSSYQTTMQQTKNSFMSIIKNSNVDIELLK